MPKVSATLCVSSQRQAVQGRGRICGQRRMTNLLIIFELVIVEYQAGTGVYSKLLAGASVRLGVDCVPRYAHKLETLIPIGWRSRGCMGQVAFWGGWWTGCFF